MLSADFLCTQQGEEPRWEESASLIEPSRSMNGVGATGGGATLGILLGADPQGGLRVEALDSSSPNSASVQTLNPNPPDPTSGPCCGAEPSEGSSEGSYER